MRAFLESEQPSLAFELEPSNHHDGNAIRVLGYSCRVPRWHVGYVPSELAADLARLGLSDRVRPRLTKTYVTGDGTAGVALALLGPKTEVARYRAGCTYDAVESSAARRRAGKRRHSHPR